MTLVDYLRELAKNPGKVKDFKKNPTEALRGVALSDEEKQLLIKGDWQTIRNRIGSEEFVPMWADETQK